MSRYNDLIDRLDGYTVGTLIVDDNLVVLHSGGRYLTLDHAKSIEVLREAETDSYYAVTYEQCLTFVDHAGWPLLAGLYARVKF
ncbi:hypothetical protein [Bacillus sp. 03113]|uniref:hypothetical protein n=1 Tax=Bacillus sp. 03113 TaxID=2578211 RepID=UPI00114282BB|nr:hypothetical protein [Bacillus sp. 03113]